MNSIINILASILLLGLATCVSAEDLTAKIESCSGCALNKLPELKDFIKGDKGAIVYRNVEIEFIRGKKATVSFMEEGVEIENHLLSNFETQGEMHRLFIENGFVRKTREEIVADVEARRIAELTEKEEKARKKDEKYRKMTEEDKAVELERARKKDEMWLKNEQMRIKKEEERIVVEEKERARKKEEMYRKKVEERNMKKDRYEEEKAKRKAERQREVKQEL